MRTVTPEEKKKRGCSYCTDVGRHYDAQGGGVRTACPHDECPYKVLDKYGSYDAYMKSEDSTLDVVALFNGK